MAQARETAFNPSSPHSSSGGADSYKNEGTPDTRLTAFSPDGNSARSGKLLTVVNLNPSSDANPIRFQVKQSEGYSVASGNVEKDPFISNTNTSKAEQKLSPTASAFRPVANPLVANGTLTGQSSSGTISSPSFHLFNSPGAARFSAELGISRYVVISDPSKPVTTGNVEEYFEKLENQLDSSCQGKRSSLPEGGRVYLRLTNVQYARIVHDCVHLFNKNWRAEYISSIDFYRVVNPGVHIEAVPEGQVYVIARPALAAGPAFSPSNSEAFVLNLLQGEGEVFAFRRHGEANATVFQSLVEFADLDVAVAAATKFNGATIAGIQLWLTLCDSDATTSTRSAVDGYSPSRAPVNDMMNLFQEMSVNKTPQLAHGASFMPNRIGQPNVGTPVPQHQIAMYPVVYHNNMSSPSNYVVDQTPTRRPSGPSFGPMTPVTGGMPVLNPVYTPPATPMAFTGDYTSPRGMLAYGRPDSRRQNAMRVSRSPYHSATGHHNQVDVDRIREGIDVRTTIMLRNIPNKVDQAMLKRIIDESSWGKYDFMYLRIDFANDCNVGYAFINFVDPLDIVDFVNARANQRWNCFKSDKVAEVSYATIQGKDCLVQKFRNSSVMLEAPHYRPKLYYTSNGPAPELAGQEESFPDPDNQSKMKRSCENAEHVGLFTPNAGQHFRDEQRRRRSQYDRGTRLAALEEYDYDAHIQHPGFMPMGN